MKSKIIQIFEKNIMTKLAFVLVAIIVLCIGFVMLTKSLFSEFRKQQEHYRYNTQVLLEINGLLSQFYDIQEYGNLFLVQKEVRYLNIYQMQIDTFQQKLEHIVQFIQRDDENKYLADITILLHEKKIMLKKLQQLFVNKKDIDQLYQKIATKIEEEIHRDVLQPEVSTTMQQDTVWQEHKKFGQRLRDAFRSSKKREKNILTINTLVIVDTIVPQSFVVNSLLDSLYEFTQQYQHEYTTKINKIEIELYALLTADQYITKEITNLLMQLHEEMLWNVISLGEEYEENAQRALMRSVVAGTIALLLITALIIFIFKNVKTIRKTNDALASAKQKTEELMESRHQLLLITSHDIKTPLSALLGYLELWENERLSPKQLRELNIMQYTGKSILALLNNLLEFSRLEQQKAQIMQENIEIVPFFMEIVEMFQPLCSEKKNKLNYFIDVKNNPQILTDSLKLKQITVNLISNAIKYTSEGEISVRIEEISESDLQLKVIVSDTGKGIPKEKRSSLFEPFTRVEKNSFGIEGSGLGLFVVKGLVDLLGGTVEIQTEENQGTAITFTVPFERVSTSAGAPAYLFSLHTLNELLDNDQETIFALLHTFTTSLPDDIQKLERVLEEENLFLLQQIVHRLLPLTKQIHADEVIPILEKIDISRTQNHVHFNDFKADVISLISNLKKLLSAIQTFL